MLACTPAVEQLMLAIQAHEGWHPMGSSKYPLGSRSFRYHNPGNLRKSPFAFKVLDGYCVFVSDFVGFNALHWDLLQKARGNTVTALGPSSTLRDLIYTYAPPKDNNDSARYLSEVVRMTGLAESTTLAEIFSF